MNKPLTEELQLLLAEYLQCFVTLRSPQSYPGSVSLIQDYEKIKDHSDADRFFGTYGVGNTVFVSDKPFERIKAYELLTYILKSYDSDQYTKIHKGTPYYFIAWTAYQSGNFEKALFYMDSAVSEDLRIYEARGKKETPALSFFLLRDTAPATGLLTLHVSVNVAIQNTFSQYYSDSNQSLLKEVFINKFVEPILFGDIRQRSVLTALYGFFLEFELFHRQIYLRSADGGSIEPFVNHLFKGARILESILKLKGKGSSLEDLIKNLEQLGVNNTLLKGNRTLNSALTTYHDLKSKGEKFQDYNFATAYIIRNTTGHSLVWSDGFKEDDSYSTLYKSLVNSILWGINKLWLE